MAELEGKMTRYKPVSIPAEKVPISGVLNRESIFPIHSNINPSADIA